ncbi:hypothetical protein SPRG_11656 [Saprolegnia parasitica CBS 223.65]|uniref:CENP-V/GFA domain-containing protein n=1 Tax=Saprolegnia parasitica (strain CBS 223.65) TaxID=695850 RepID=A0A067C953_SAPPC|nr:hypothetical protein SPRG_11656 [Saprolegnia parasitica CBS 223.65]KDO23342.1 hypothetical protein SPRG_11656 [Saprolegnia parasitica CBS 223.65]|eukprot:XP_012205993.1 hypothetical protein SPRG_11656 [Saprolegnia parasitica CBS 223.65]
MYSELLAAVTVGLLGAVTLTYKRTHSPPLCAAIACACGQVQGRVDAPAATRLVCYCTDCNAFATKVSKTNAPPLDASGGTDILQLFPADLTFSRGAEHLTVGILSPETATLRVFASCCAAFAGLLASVLQDKSLVLPPIQFRIFARSATGPVPDAPVAAKAVSVRFVVNFIVRSAVYRGRASPAPVALTPRVLL